MTETKKVTQANYSEEMVSRLHEVYKPEDSEEHREEQLQALSDELGKGVKSIRAKLVREGLYVKKEYKTKDNKKAETKETIVGQIADALSVDADTSLSGLEKATKNCLLFLRTTVQAAAKLADSVEETEVEETQAE